MKIVKATAAFAVFAVTATAHAASTPQIYKCQSHDGKGVVFTDSPAQHAKCKSLAVPDVEVGMSSTRAQEIAGTPVKVTFVKTRKGKSERWIYGTGLTLTIENGLVEKIEQQ
jgi:hypothetical protein